MCSGKIRSSNILVYVEIGTGSKILCPALPKAKTSESEARKCLLIEKMLLEVGVGGLKASTNPPLENPEFRLLLRQGKGE